MSRSLAFGLTGLAVAALLLGAPLLSAYATSSEWYWDIDSVNELGLEGHFLENDRLGSWFMKDLTELYVAMEYSNPAYDRFLLLNTNWWAASVILTEDAGSGATRVHKTFYEGDVGCDSSDFNVIDDCYKLDGRLTFYDYNAAGTGGSPKVKEGIRSWGTKYASYRGYPEVNPRFSVTFVTGDVNPQDVKYKDYSDCSGWIPLTNEELLFSAIRNSCTGQVFRVYDTFSTLKGWGWDPQDSDGWDYALEWISSEETASYQYEEDSWNGNADIDGEQVRFINWVYKQASSTQCDPDSPCNIDAGAWLLFGYSTS